MKKKFTILVLTIATGVIFLPTPGSAFDAKNKTAVSAATENLVLQQRRGRGRNSRYWDNRGGRRNSRYWDNRGRRRNGTWYGYRNYGQYRRTQVGNRRYRTVRQSVWRDGRRVSIWRRIFY